MMSTHDALGRVRAAERRVRRALRVWCDAYLRWFFTPTDSKAEAWAKAEEEIARDALEHAEQILQRRLMTLKNR